MCVCVSGLCAQTGLCSFVCTCAILLSHDARQQTQTWSDVSVCVCVCVCVYRRLSSYMRLSSTLTSSTGASWWDCHGAQQPHKRSVHTHTYTHTHTHTDYHPCLRIPSHVKTLQGVCARTNSVNRLQSAHEHLCVCVCVCVCVMQVLRDFPFSDQRVIHGLLAELGLWFLIYTESSSLRHTPELMWFIYW